MISLHLEIHYGPPNTARAIQTELGWIASGKTDLPSAETFQTQIVNSESGECCEIDDTLYNEVLNWYKVENLPSNKDVTKSETDKRAADVLESTVEFKEGRYHVGFLWKNKPNQPNNLPLAFKQLNSLDKRLERDPELLEKYTETIDEDLKKARLKRFL